MDAGPVRPAPLPSRDAVLFRADQLVERLRVALNQEDAETIAALSASPPEIPDVRAAEAALRDYRRYFGDAEVVDAVRTGSAKVEPHEGADARLIYDLSARNGTKKAVLVYYESRFDTMRVFDEIVRYSGRVREHAAAVVEAIRSGDADELASLLSVDTRPFPVSLARRGIEHYAERFDLETLDAVFVGLGTEGRMRYHRPFLFSLRGSKNGSVLSHQVRVEARDDLLFWVDPLIPERPEV